MPEGSGLLCRDCGWDFGEEQLVGEAGSDSPGRRAHEKANKDDTGSKVMSPV